jgi:hypothetical protein
LTGCFLSNSVSSWHTAAALLPQILPAMSELRGHRRRHRARDHPRLRRQGPPLRQVRESPSVVERKLHRRVQSASLLSHWLAYFLAPLAALFYLYFIVWMPFTIAAKGLISQAIRASCFHNATRYMLHVTRY